MKRLGDNMGIQKRMRRLFRNDDNSAYRCGKRIFDLLFSLFLLMLLSPLMFLISIILFLQFGKNPLFMQRRALALDRHSFTILKFRTMPAPYASLSGFDIFIKKMTPRGITKFASWLRKTGLDELPQLVNVLKGDMSFIGPRPLSMEDLQCISSMDGGYHHRRSMLKSKPGISGLWQIFGRRSDGVRNLVLLDCMYERKRSFAFDMYLIWKTIPVMLLAIHSDAILGEKKLELSVRENPAEKGSVLITSSSSLPNETAG